MAIETRSNANSKSSVSLPFQLHQDRTYSERTFCATSAASALLTPYRQSRFTSGHTNGNTIVAIQNLMEVRLWRAVIVRLFRMGFWASSAKTRSWRTSTKPQDCLLVCESAGLDAGRLRSKLARLKPSQEIHVPKVGKAWARCCCSSRALYPTPLMLGGHVMKQRVLTFAQSPLKSHLC